MATWFYIAAGLTIALAGLGTWKSQKDAGRRSRQNQATISKPGQSAAQAAESHFSEIQKRTPMPGGGEIIRGRPRNHWPQEMMVTPQGISAGPVSKTHDGYSWQKTYAGKSERPSRQKEIERFAAQLERQLPAGSPVSLNPAPSGKPAPKNGAAGQEEAES